MSTTKHVTLSSISSSLTLHAYIYPSHELDISVNLCNNKGAMLAYIGITAADDCRVCIDAEGHAVLWIGRTAFDLAKKCAQRAATELGIKLIDERTKPEAK